MQKNRIIGLICLVFLVSKVKAQIDAKIDTLPTQELKEVVLSSDRIEITLSENSKNLQIITADQIRQSGVTHLVDLLQQIAGVDIKRRGTGATQADLNIRGGTFDQTLLLID